MRNAPDAGIDALLFDLGGVLIEIDFSRAFAAWGAAAGVPAQSIARRFRFDEHYAAHERGEIGAPEYFASLRRALGISLPDEQLLAGWNAIFAGEITGMRELLVAAAQRYALYLFSNTCDSHRAHWMPRFEDLLRPISGRYLSCEIGMRKPQPEAFALVARRIGVPPDRIAFFDDLEENVAGARRAGLRAHRFESPSGVAAALDLSL